MTYPEEHFGLEATLTPVIAYLSLCRWEDGVPESVRTRLGYINSLLFELIQDDLLGLIDATPEERVRLAYHLQEASDVD
ncbi:MAG: hypothetical protein AAFQ22_04515 [Pseudomonadota bacterium]